MRPTLTPTPHGLFSGGIDPYFINDMLGVFTVIGLAVLAIVWILFPFFVVIRLGRIIKIATEVKDDAWQAAHQTNQLLSEQNKALQWMIDAWSERMSRDGDCA